MAETSVFYYKSKVGGEEVQGGKAPLGSPSDLPMHAHAHFEWNCKKCEIPCSANLLYIPMYLQHKYWAIC